MPGTLGGALHLGWVRSLLPDDRVGISRLAVFKFVKCLIDSGPGRWLHGLLCVRPCFRFALDWHRVGYRTVIKALDSTQSVREFKACHMQLKAAESLRHSSLSCSGSIWHVQCSLAGTFTCFAACLVRAGKVAMLIIMAGAYFLDATRQAQAESSEDPARCHDKEQTRLQSYEQASELPQFPFF